MSRGESVQTIFRNYTRDEGGPFGVGYQVTDPKPLQASVVKSDGGERCRNVGTRILAGKIERGERKRTAVDVSKAIDVVKTTGWCVSWDKFGGCPDTDRTASGM